MLGIEIVSVALRYVVQIVLARLAGVDNYGLYTYAFTWAQMLAVPAGLGMSSAVMRYVPAYRVTGDWPRLRGLLKASSRLTTASGALAALVGVAVVLLTHSSSAEQTSLLLGVALVPLLSVNLLQSEVLRGGQQLFLARVVPAVVQPCLTVGCALLLNLGRDGLSGTDILVCLLVAYLAGSLVQRAALRRPLGHGDRHDTSPCYETREWLRVAIPLLFVKGFQLVLNLSDVLIVGLVLGPAAAGVYALALKTATLSGLVFQGVNLAMSPTISHAYARQNKPEMQEALRLGARLSFWPSLVLTSGLVLCSNDVMQLFGPGFEVGATALVVLAAGRLLNAVTGPVGMVLNVTGHERLSARVYGAAAVLQVALDVVLIPRFGITGAAIAATAAMASWNVALYVLVVRRLQMRLWPMPLGGGA